MVRGSVAQGLLMDKPAKTYLDYSAGDVAKMAAVVHSISNKERSATQSAIKYVLHNKAVTSAVVGMRTIEQVEEAINTLNVPDLTPSEMEKLKNVLKPNTYKEHR